MAKMAHGSSCPQCGEGEVRRTHRQPWMRRLPKTKCFKCRECGAQFLTICGWAIRLKKNPPAEDS